jgi:hypothetical protein
MVYEGILTGFDKFASTNDEHKFILMSLFGDDNKIHRDIQYRRNDNIIMYRTVHKPIIDSNSVQLKVKAGSRIIVEILANALDENRRPITEVMRLKHWLSGCGDRNGFNVVDGNAHFMSPLKINSSNGKSFVLHRVSIMAVITITEPSKFVSFYETGAGKSCYGFGMLQIR